MKWILVYVVSGLVAAVLSVSAVSLAEPVSCVESSLLSCNWCYRVRFYYVGGGVK